ncbi:MAG TPA: ketopantoate reductase family protein [Thermoplasmatales archaeon]|nr:ketopantoate reductase family protein [Thermoplasmatales archaeon]
MRFIIYGAGALGSLFGGLLSIHNDVVLIGKEEHMKVVKKNGLKIEGITNKTFYPSVDIKMKKYDVIILTTKAYDTEKAVKEILRKFGKMPVLSLQNGLKNEEIISEIMGEEYALGGVTSHGATFIENGKIFHAGKGETIIGEMNGELTERIKRIAYAFNKCGIETEISRNIKEEIWKKAIINASINGLTSILKCRNGYLVENKNAEILLEKICRECIEISRRNGIDVGEEMIEKAREVARRTSKNISSMLQDLLNGKKTEIDEINGAFIEMAKKKGMEVPVNEFVHLAVKSMENVRHLG